MDFVELFAHIKEKHTVLKLKTWVFKVHYLKIENNLRKCLAERAWEELRREVGAGGRGRADDDAMTSSVKTRVECQPG